MCTLWAPPVRHCRRVGCVAPVCAATELIWKKIRYLAYLDDKETIVNTHPVCFIGADNKGLDQLLCMPGGKNRDSHGSYPFPGMYKDIGPAGATISF